MPDQPQTRKRNSSPRILAAARTIAVRDGVARVSIEAIAREAGLSKGGVLHNFPTKRVLMEAMLEEMLEEHRALHANLPETEPRSTLRQHLLTLRSFSRSDSDLSMAILAVAAVEPDLLEPLRNVLKTDLAIIGSETNDPTTARILFFALQGIRFHKLLKLPDGGSAVLDDLAARIEEMDDDAS
ncbi:TetR/AcrR family transcriptional regulator [Rhodovulum sp.]|uniref:TetR/AcrR family transcriptional regulator n=1 Tax=Rhodovulum sp. TaxID=34009 RepID=UPI001846AFCE|nr:TetR/AcrR family transcriptional regulator [Rhodovulum sp.]HDR29410.1 TetR/AcrR family transcriptional regulator [Rhodovulum sp.]